MLKVLSKNCSSNSKISCFLLADLVKRSTCSMLYFKRQSAVARLKQDIVGEGVLIKHFYQCDVIIRMIHHAIFRPKFLEIYIYSPCIS